MREQESRKVVFRDLSILKQVVGINNEHLKIVAEAIGDRLGQRGNEIRIEGDPLEADLASRLLEQLGVLVEKGYPLYPADVDYAIRLLSENHKVSLEEVFLDTVYISGKRKVISPKSIRQKQYIDAIRTNDIVIAIGPAGTGKTYLAMAMAVSELMKHRLNASSWPVPPWRQGKNWDFFRGISSRRSIPIFVPCMTPSTI
jgi:phosphate starvation-inducible PhoH-like protein